MQGQKGNIHLFYILVILAIAGILVYSFKFKDSTSTNPTPSPSPTTSSSTNITVKTTQNSSPKPSTSPTPSPTTSTKDIIARPPNLPFSIEIACSGDHDNLGNHLDVTLKLDNAANLGATHLYIYTTDTVSQKRSEYRLAVQELINQSIKLHKYLPSNIDGSPYQQPLEMIADGRNYHVTVYKGDYKGNYVVDNYTYVAETDFSKKCDF